MKLNRDSFRIKINWWEEILYPSSSCTFFQLLMIHIKKSLWSTKLYILLWAPASLFQNYFQKGQRERERDDQSFSYWLRIERQTSDSQMEMEKSGEKVLWKCLAAKLQFKSFPIDQEIDIPFRDLYVILKKIKSRRRIRNLFPSLFKLSTIQSPLFFLISPTSLYVRFGYNIIFT